MLVDVGYEDVLRAFNSNSCGLGLGFFPMPMPSVVEATKESSTFFQLSRNGSAVEIPAAEGSSPRKWRGYIFRLKHEIKLTHMFGGSTEDRYAVAIFRLNPDSTQIEETVDSVSVPGTRLRHFDARVGNIDGTTLYCGESYVVAQGFEDSGGNGHYYEVDTVNVQHLLSQVDFLLDWEPADGNSSFLLGGGMQGEARDVEGSVTQLSSVKPDLGIVVSSVNPSPCPARSSSATPSMSRTPSSSYTPSPPEIPSKTGSVSPSQTSSPSPEIPSKTSSISPSKTPSPSSTPFSSAFYSTSPTVSRFSAVSESQSASPSKASSASDSPAPTAETVPVPDSSSASESPQQTRHLYPKYLPYLPVQVPRRAVI